MKNYRAPSTRKRLLLGGTVAVIISVGMGAGATPAFASSEVKDTSSASGDVQLGTMVEGVFTPLDPSSVAAHTLNLHATSTPKPGTVSSNLLSYDQWFGCYSLNHEDDIFSTYYTPSVNQQPGRTINLRCGNNSFGYKHIHAEHDGNWSDTYNAAKAKGWVPGSQGFQSSDDLMSESAGTAIGYPNYYSIKPVNQTTCAVVNMDFFKQGVGVVYSFNVVAVYSNTNDRLITTYPTSKTVC